MYTDMWLKKSSVNTRRANHACLIVLLTCVLACQLAANASLNSFEHSLGYIIAGIYVLINSPVIFFGTAIWAAFGTGSWTLRFPAGLLLAYIYFVASFLILGEISPAPFIVRAPQWLMFSAVPGFLWMSVAVALSTHRRWGRRWNLSRTDHPSVYTPKIIDRVGSCAILAIAFLSAYRWLEPCVPNASILFFLVYHDEIHANLFPIWVCATALIALLLHILRLGRIHLFERMPSLFWQYMLASLMFAFVCMAIMSISIRQLRFGSRSYYEKIFAWGGMSASLSVFAVLCFLAAWCILSPRYERIATTRTRRYAIFLCSVFFWPISGACWVLRYCGFRLMSKPAATIRDTQAGREHFVLPLITVITVVLGSFAFEYTGITKLLQQEMFNYNVIDFVTDTDYLDHLQHRHGVLRNDAPNAVSMNVLTGRFITGKWLMGLKPHHRLEAFFINYPQSPNLKDEYFVALSLQPIERFTINAEQTTDLSFIKMLPRLESLQLTGFRGRTNELSLRNCPNLSIIDLKNGVVDRQVLYAIGDTPKTQTLRLHDVHVDGGIVDGLRFANGLQHLELIGNYPHENIYEFLELLPALKSFKTSVPPTMQDIQSIFATSALRKLIVTKPANLNSTQIRLLLNERPDLTLSAILKSTHGTHIRAQLNKSSLAHWQKQLGWPAR